LQFIKARHLELDCLIVDSTVNGNKESNENEMLCDPIGILESLDCYFSPFEKLQTILAVYQSVNAALWTALNAPDDSQQNTSSQKKLPSADDVLPTLILTVIRAKPLRLLWNMRFIEVFSRPESLRGEAGYAYTNLYGAIQFLQEMNLVDDNQSIASLSISPEEFRDGLQASRKAAEEKLKVPVANETKTASLDGPSYDRMTQLPIQIVRDARMRGDTLNLDWVRSWRETSNLTNIESLPSVDALNDSVVTNEMLGVPRQYSFLTARPEDIRLTDLPELLSEYRLLVHATERLLAERASEVKSARKKKIVEQRNSLMAKAEAADGAVHRPEKKL
jgi:hypothetical protein